MADNINENTVGWGVPFTKFIDTTRLNYFNGAMEGKSSRSFITEGLWEVILDDLKPEDFVLIQFGHHDNSIIDKDNSHGTLDGTGFETHKIVRNDSVQETIHTFGHYLRKMVIETKLKGALPIVLSLTPKNEWSKEQAEQKQDTYVKWTQEIAHAEEIPFIDLNDAIAKKYEQLGKEKVQEFFPKDDTHTNSEGALFSAQVAAEALKNHKASGLKDYIFY